MHDPVMMHWRKKSCDLTMEWCRKLIDCLVYSTTIGVHTERSITCLPHHILDIAMLCKVMRHNTFSCPITVTFSLYHSCCESYFPFEAGRIKNFCIVSLTGLCLFRCTPAGSSSVRAAGGRTQTQDVVEEPQGECRCKGLDYYLGRVAALEIVRRAQ